MKFLTPPKVSAIMAARNVEKYIGQAIKSILNQTYQNFEIIIIDDNSQDSTIEIIKKYKEPRIRLFSYRRSPCEGLGALRNYGIKNSTGELIAICDADDIRYSKSFEKEVAVFEKHLNVGLVGTQYDEIDKSGNIIDKRNAETLYQATGYQISSEGYRDETGWRRSLGGVSSYTLRQILLTRKGSYSCPLAPTTTMFRRLVFEDVGGYENSRPYFLDVRLHRRIAEKYDIVLLKDILAGWRQHPKRMSIEQWKKGGEQV